MQSSKTSKTSRKKATDTAVAVQEEKPATELKKTVRRTASSKKTTEPVSAAAKSHRRSAPAANETVSEASGSKVSLTPKAARTPGHDEVAMLAYSFWVERNYQHGFSEHDWHRAVEQLSQNQ